MDKFEIWMEGYIGPSNSGRARLLDTVEAASFPEACAKVANSLPRSEGNFDRTNLTFWGSRLFDNEVDARAKFG